MNEGRHNETDTVITMTEQQTQQATVVQLIFQ